MKIFKSVDVMIQLNLIVFGVIIGVLNPNYAIYSYFIVGGWQLLSCVIHGVFPGHYNSVQARKYYLLALLILILLLLDIIDCLWFIRMVLLQGQKQLV